MRSTARFTWIGFLSSWVMAQNIPTNKKDVIEAELKHLDLFSGIGGFALAARWAGFKTVQFVERDTFCQKVLTKNFPGVPIHDDIKTFKGNYGSTNIITGGFPCQPFSVAGKHRGTADDRALWPEMFRIIQNSRPAWVLGENVAGLINMGIGEMLADLEAIGYDSQTLVIPACAINAPHRRNRIWIIAHTNQGGRGSGEQKLFARDGNMGNDFQPNGKSNGVETWFDWHTKKTRWNLEIESTLFGKKDGLSERLDETKNRLKALGNAIVPQVAYQILKAIKED